MHPYYLPRRRTLAALALSAGLFGGAAGAQPPAQPPVTGSAPAPVQAKVDPKTGSIFVPVQGIVRFTTGTGKAIQSITFTKDQVVQWKLIPTQPDAVDLIGIGAGLTDMVIRFNDGTTVQVSVIAQPDYDLLKNVIKRTLPTASIDVVPGVGQAIILTGYVNRPEDSALVEQIARAAIGGAAGGAPGGGGGTLVNAIRVGGSQHVLIDVVVAQVDRSEIRTRGSDFFFQGTQASGGSFLSGLLSVQTGGVGTTTVSPQANLQLGIAPAGLAVAIQALRTENLAKLLAEPKVVTQSGRPAYILSGGRQAVLGPASGITGPGVQYENIGTQLEVLPIVQGDGKILLEINPTITAVNAGLGITVNGALSPGFSTQTARAVVSLESGQTFAIGGLIQNTVQAVSNKVPLLGDLPYFGAAFFSNIHHEERESELIILVTPRLVEPLDCAQAPRRVPGRETRSPDDHELYLETLLEAPRGQRQVWNGHCYNAAYKCDVTSNRFPCLGDVCHGPASLLTGGGCGAGGCAPAAAAPGTTPASLPAMPVGTPAETPAPAIDAPVLAPAAPAAPVVPLIDGTKH